MLPLTQAAWGLSGTQAGLIQPAYWLHLLVGLCSGGTYTPVLALINEHVAQARRARSGCGAAIHRLGADRRYCKGHP